MKIFIKYLLLILVTIGMCLVSFEVFGQDYSYKTNDSLVYDFTFYISIDNDYATQESFNVEFADCISPYYHFAKGIEIKCINNKFIPQIDFNIVKRYLKRIP